MSSSDEPDLPVWQREHIFPAKPEGSAYGVFTSKGRGLAFGNSDELIAHLQQWKEPGSLIWTPDRERCFPPEEDIRFLDVLRKRKSSQAEDDWSASRFRAFLFALPLIYSVWSAAAHGQLHRSQSLGLFGVIWLMLAGIPAYEAWKRKRRAAALNAESLGGEAQEVRFEIWLRRQHIPITKALLGGLIGVYLVQVWSGMEDGLGILSAIWYPKEVWGGAVQTAGVAAAGLVKSHAGMGYFSGEWWRLFTAPTMHGLLIHIVMNGLGLLYLGRRAEVMAGWPHLLLVFLFAMISGGVASAHGSPESSSVGASGGIMGLLGFLLVFEYLHGRLVPKRATRRLLAAIGFTFVIGFVGYQNIDNWAHGGGLVAGMLYAGIVFPSSCSPHRPRATRMDVVFGLCSGLAVLAGAVYAVVRMRGFM